MIQEGALSLFAIRFTFLLEQTMLISSLLKRKKLEENSLGALLWLGSFGACFAFEENVGARTHKLPFHITFVKSSVEVLWETEQPAKQTQSSNWPVFSMTFKDQRYTIGLLWLNEKRPNDNREQAFLFAAH